MIKHFLFVILLFAFAYSQACPQCFEQSKYCWFDKQCSAAENIFMDCAQIKCSYIPLQDNNKQWDQCWKNECKPANPHRF